MPKGTLIQHDGQEKSIRQWAAWSGIPYRSLIYRMKSGWDISRALTEKTLLGRNQSSGKPARTKERILETVRSAMSRYRKRHRERVAVQDKVLKAKRRAVHRLATPAWADRCAMRVIYEQARRITRETGIQHDVDHIVPLKSKLVCGLHVHCNLRVIPASENAKKNNRYWPDMP